jgi:hypothetical protein
VRVQDPGYESIGEEEMNSQVRIKLTPSQMKELKTLFSEAEHDGPNFAGSIILQPVWKNKKSAYFQGGYIPRHYSDRIRAILDEVK